MMLCSQGCASCLRRVMLAGLKGLDKKNTPKGGDSEVPRSCQPERASAGFKGGDGSWDSF